VPKPLLHACSLSPSLADIEEASVGVTRPSPQFFATDSAAPFTDSSHWELMLDLFETGTGDPLRWSAARVEQSIGGTSYSDDSIPLEVALDAPDLLRAFIPYAHAQSGIRDELTSRTLAMVDALRSSYEREVLKQAKYWGLDDAV
jgi:hypothetical protein